jgi:hypothetical protein
VASFRLLGLEHLRRIPHPRLAVQWEWLLSLGTYLEHLTTVLSGWLRIGVLIYKASLNPMIRNLR